MRPQHTTQARAPACQVHLDASLSAFLDELTCAGIALAAFALGILLTALFSRQARRLALLELESSANEEHSDELRALEHRLATAEEKNSRIPELAQDLAEGEQIISALQREQILAEKRISVLEAQLDKERSSIREKVAAFEEARTRLSDTFQALSGEALRQNNQSFLDLARGILGQVQEASRGDLEKRQDAIQGLVGPVRESLDRMDAKIADLENARTGAYESLTAQVRGLSETQHQLRTETGNLARALHSPVVRGRWGEIQLRRVVELAGMIDHCDFSEQVTVTNGERSQRPDLVVRLPGGKHLVVDAKAPLDAYLQSLEAVDDVARLAKVQQHTAQIRAHIERLSRKAYWEQFETSPEFVVLFLPGEVFFSAALERDPELIEYGADRRIILATPTTLIALLRAVFHGWRQEKLAQNAEKISALGRELFKRLADMSGHLDRVGRSLNVAVESYNKAAATMESRVFVTARRFQELEAAPSDTELPPLQIVEQAARHLTPPTGETAGMVPLLEAEVRLDEPEDVTEK